jgi:hypothetical protein
MLSIDYYSPPPYQKWSIQSKPRFFQKIKNTYPPAEITLPHNISLTLSTFSPANPIFSAAAFTSR